MLAEIIAFIVVISLILYVLLGGADFGAGLWDLFALGPRAERQRRLIEKAVAPVWEANHVWLILILVLLFTAFPPAFSQMAIHLHVPLTLLLVGIVLRGSAFVFRQYGLYGEKLHRGWSLTFAIASVIAPLFLGVCLAAVSSGNFSEPFGWFGLFPFLVGGFALSLMSFLAAVYLTNETSDTDLQDDFRKRAMIGFGLMAFFGIVCLIPNGEAMALKEKFFESGWHRGLRWLTYAISLATLYALHRRRFRLARGGAIATVVLVIGGWASAQYPYLIRASLTIAQAAAPDSTLKYVVISLGAGAIFLFPSLYWLFRIFKR